MHNLGTGNLHLVSLKYLKSFHAVWEVYERATGVPFQ